MKKFTILIWFFAAFACEGQDEAKKNLNLLFVGNSLTYTNNLPQLMTDLAKNGNVKIRSKSLTYPNYGLLDHWDDGDLQDEIKKGKYDFVIIQQGPSSQRMGREWLIDYGKLMGDLCTSNNAQLVYFMVWPSRTYYHTFDGVIKNHRDAAQINNALLAPVGEAWKAYFDETEDFSYYGSDGFHPSSKGSQIAAEVILETLLNADE